MTYPTKQRINFCYLGKMKLRSVGHNDYPPIDKYAMPGHRRVQDRFEPPSDLSGHELKDLGQRLGVEVIFKRELVMANHTAKAKCTHY